MTKQEIDLAVTFLRTFGDIIDKKSVSRDFGMQDTPENRALVTEANQGMVDLYVEGGKVWTTDCLLIKHLANKMEKSGVEKA